MLGTLRGSGVLSLGLLWEGSGRALEGCGSAPGGALVLWDFGSSGRAPGGPWEGSGNSGALWNAGGSGVLCWCTEGSGTALEGLWEVLWEGLWVLWEGSGDSGRAL